MCHQLLLETVPGLHSWECLEVICTLRVTDSENNSGQEGNLELGASATSGSSSKLESKILIFEIRSETFSWSHHSHFEPLPRMGISQCLSSLAQEVGHAHCEKSLLFSAKRFSCCCIFYVELRGLGVLLLFSLLFSYLGVWVGWLGFFVVQESFLCFGVFFPVWKFKLKEASKQKSRK